MQICPNEQCGNKSRTCGSAVYCTKCGTELIPAPKCPGCKKELGHYDKFCEECGRPIQTV